MSAFEQALALHQQGQLAQAQELYLQALQLQPEHFDALHMLGVLAYQLGHAQRALDFIVRAIAICPDHAMAHSNRGSILRALGQHQAAVSSYDRAIALKADLAGTYQNRGNALLDLKQYAQALQSYDQALAGQIKSADLYNRRGVVLRALGQYQAALESYDQALMLQADDPAIHNNRGNILRDLKQYPAALESYDLALALQADDPGTHCNRGAVLEDLKQYRAALDSYNQAIKLDPSYAQAYSSRGDVLHQLKQHQAALSSYERAIALNPKYVSAYSNRGVVLRSLRQHQAALQSYEQAITIQADFAQAHWNQSLCYLQLGQFERGWQTYEWRWKTPHFESDIRPFSVPLWLGETSLQGKTIVLHSEQGLGDTLQFCRYASLVHALGARVILEVQQPLVALLGSLAGVAQVLARGDALPTFDCHCPLLSLPLALKTRMNSIPASERYLTSSPDKLAYWRAELDLCQQTRVGLVWSGSAQHGNDSNRSLKLADWLRSLPVGAQYVSLQKEVRKEDREVLSLRSDIMCVDEQLIDFADTAALCEALDLIVSVDTSVAHLAGAIGKPVWVLLPFSADWRWLLGRSDSPWYPSMRLYQQGKIDTWHEVFEQVAVDLKRLFLGGRPV